MAIQVDAVYENGVLKPLRPLDLAENEQVVVVIKEAQDESDDEAVRKKLDANQDPIPGWVEARKILSKVQGSLSEVIIASRGPR